MKILKTGATILLSFMILMVFTIEAIALFKIVGVEENTTVAVLLSNVAINYGIVAVMLVFITLFIGVMVATYYAVMWANIIKTDNQIKGVVVQILLVFIGIGLGLFIYYLFSLIGDMGYIDSLIASTLTTVLIMVNYLVLHMVTLIWNKVMYAEDTFVVSYKGKENTYTEKVE